MFMAKKYNILIERDEDGWLVSEVIGLPGCHTQARSFDDLISRTKEAISAYLEENDTESDSEFVGIQQIEV
jgi:predicted RNase H-like HicB family nuclease